MLIWVERIQKALKTNLFPYELLEVLIKSWDQRWKQRIEIGVEEDKISGDDFQVLYLTLKWMEKENRNFRERLDNLNRQLSDKSDELIENEIEWRVAERLIAAGI